MLSGTLTLIGGVRNVRRGIGTCALLCTALLPALAWGATIDPGSSTGVGWTAILYPSTNPDPFGDQGTGDREGDIVGDATHAALYTVFDDNNTLLDKQDGNIAFRVRISGQTNPPGFGNFLAIGIDAGEDANNDIDLYLGVDGQGSNDKIGIYGPGAGANISPSTTTLDNVPSISWLLSTGPTGNYDWSAVTTTNDPTATILDFGADGNDYFLTFIVPFDELVKAFGALPTPIVIDEDTAFRYVMGTGSQPNALNQDVGGTSALWNNATTWENLGAISSPYSASGNPVATPEPGTAALTLLGLVGLAATRRRARR